MTTAAIGKKGKLAVWFEELYAEISKMPMYKGLIPYMADAVHDGYFSADKKKGKVVEELDTTGGTAKDDETYELIMKDKERLLNADEPLRFLFSAIQPFVKAGTTLMYSRFAPCGKWEPTGNAARPSDAACAYR